MLCRNVYVTLTVHFLCPFFHSLFFPPLSVLPFPSFLGAIQDFRCCAGRVRPFDILPTTYSGMSTLKVISINIRGLCSPGKRNKLWWELKKLKAHMVFIQETHFTHHSLPRLTTHLFNQWFHSTSPTSKSKGNTIAIHRNCPFQLLDSKIDPLGRYVFLKGVIAGRKYTFASIYAPNSNQITFIDSALDLLADFKEGFVILGGDFNVSPDPLLDTSSSSHSHSYAFLKHFRKSFQSHLLLDSWRVLHPKERDFSYHSAVHDVYTRIDHIYVDRSTLELVQSAFIGNITLSDHAPVGVTLTLPSSSRGAWTWRLNENLLDDTAAVAKVSETITNYFNENVADNISMGIVWEGHKAVVRGELISLGVKLKKMLQADFDRVLAALQDAELKHKQNGGLEALRRLTELRDLFLRLLDQQTRKQARHLSHKYYEHGNKCGRMLARAIRKKHAQTYIQKLCSPSGEVSIQSSKIASGFQDYYARLYNLHPDCPLPNNPGPLPFETI